MSVLVPAAWLLAILAMTILAIRSEPKTIVFDACGNKIHAIYRKWLINPTKSFDAQPFSIVRSYVRGRITETIIVEIATTEEIPRSIRIGMFPTGEGKTTTGTYSHATESEDAAALRARIKSMGFTDQGYLCDFPERRGITLV